jgi:hypothetical protein
VLYLPVLIVLVAVVLVIETDGESNKNSLNAKYHNTIDEIKFVLLLPSFYHSLDPSMWAS